MTTTTTDRFTRQLDARIAARNRANEVAGELYDQMAPIFQPLLGEKVCKVDGQFSKKVADLLPDSRYPDDVWPRPTVMYYRSHSEYTVSFTVKTCASDDDGSCAYEEVTVYICDLTGGVATRRSETEPLYNKEERRSDWTAGEVLALRADYEAKKTIADDACRALWPFGTSDR
jgi:hypothetical protein